CPIIVHQRAVFGHALVGSRCAQEVEPAGKAAIEVVALWDWLARRAAEQGQFDVSGMARLMPRISAAWAGSRCRVPPRVGRSRPMAGFPLSLPLLLGGNPTLRPDRAVPPGTPFRVDRAETRGVTRTAPGLLVRTD